VAKVIAPSYLSGNIGLKLDKSTKCNGCFSVREQRTDLPLLSSTLKQELIGVLCSTQTLQMQLLLLCRRNLHWCSFVTDKQMYLYRVALTVSIKISRPL
jgi:hypothetical protein